MVAGKKDKNNTFSGVMMGDWQRGDGESANSAITQHTGIYGFQQGIPSFGFKDDGTAFIGKAGAGRIEFKGDEGKEEPLEIRFIEIAGIAHKGNFYAILQPEELIPGMNEDEALVFKVTRGENGEDKFEIELDDEIIEAVFKTYNQLLDNAQK